MPPGAAVGTVRTGQNCTDCPKCGCRLTRLRLGKSRPGTVLRVRLQTSIFDERIIPRFLCPFAVPKATASGLKRTAPALRTLKWPPGKVVEMRLVKAEPSGKALLARPDQTYKNIWAIDLGL